jgi:ectoine hydroxylase-related dioxygenase (phytanoyl-CoA dioxygenase family)
MSLSEDIRTDAPVSRWSALASAFRADGLVKLDQLLDAAMLAKCRAHYDWSVANPGPFAFNIFDGTEHRTINDNSNPAAQPRYKALVDTPVFADALAQVWGSQHVWFFGEEIFGKEGGKAGRSPWHQDTSYLPWAGAHWANLWISFEPLPKANAIEVVRGSHHGITYDGTTFTDPDDPTKPLHGGAAWPRLPDIEAERRADPASWDVVSYGTQPGDVIMLHPHCLHGGAPVDAGCPNRHTLVLRFFGDDARFRPLPEESRSGYPRQGILFSEDLAHLRDGEPFRSPAFIQIR